MGKFVAFDFETGGVIPPQHRATGFYHPPIQCAFVAIEDGVLLDSLDIKLQFDIYKCEQEALEMAHYSTERWSNAKPINLAAQMISEFFRKHSSMRVSRNTGNPYNVAQLVGHNAARFDVLYLDMLFDWKKFIGATKWVGKGGLIDTMFMAQSYDLMCHGKAFESYQLETVYQSLTGETLEDAHDALADAKATAEIASILIRIMRGYKED